MAATRAVLLNIAAFFADNNIRRSIATFSANYVTSGSSSNVNYQTVAAGATYTYTPPSLPTSVLVINSSSPLFATINFASVTLNGVTRASDSVQAVVNGNLVLDDQVTQVVLSNPQTYDIQVSIVQG